MGENVEPLPARQPPFMEATRQERRYIDKLIAKLNEAQTLAEQLNEMSKARHTPAGRRAPSLPYLRYYRELDDMKRSIRRTAEGEWGQDKQRGILRKGYTQSGNHYYKIVHRQVSKSQALLRK